jgi:hypothetical protein
VIESFLTFIYTLIDLVAIGSGAKVIFSLLGGDLLEKTAALFLRAVLATSITGLLFPSQHLPSTHGISLLSVYVSGAAILAWRKFRLALSTTMVFCLSVLVAIAQVFGILTPFTALVPHQSDSVLTLTQHIVIVSFAMLGILTTRGRAKIDHRGSTKVARGWGL